MESKVDSEKMVNESCDSENGSLLLSKKQTLSHLPRRPPVNIEFQDLTYTVPQGRKGSKIILRSISGQFLSGQLSVILGPSGAGKSTLLNVLAAYKSRGATGSILINGQPRNNKQFRKFSTYIMQEDLLQPLLTVHEAMLVAADLKLGHDLSTANKLIAIDEILDMLRLTSAKNTATDRLSGGERKRLSIALELVNNPPVIFLDEPTTGLDDLSSSQCVSLLKLLAKGGRTVICSVHTPSARLFEMFDHVYVVAAGQCVYQGAGQSIVPFMSNIGLNCPTHYNPADFVIEVSSGEYGDYIERMVTETDNGRIRTWTDSKEMGKAMQQNLQIHISHINAITEDIVEEDLKNHSFKFSCSTWKQFTILLNRMLCQKRRDSTNLTIIVCMYIFLGVVVSALFHDMGNDGSKTLFNIGFCFTCVIVFMYCPMMPVLLHFPSEVQLLKREHFNRWYGLKAYFLAMTVAQIPLQIFFAVTYLTFVYFFTGQPMEIQRICMFFSVCILISFISESFGLLISSQLNIVNGMFVGPTCSAPLILLAVYGFGSGSDNIPLHLKLAMNLSYLRYGLEGIIFAVYGGDRKTIPCPQEEEYCQFRSPKQLLELLAMENAVFWFNFFVLIFIFILFRGISYYSLRQRLSPGKTYAYLNYIGRIVKNHFNVSHR